MRARLLHDRGIEEAVLAVGHREGFMWQIEDVAILHRINRTGTTVVMVTHDSNIVNQMRRRVVEIEGGRIVRDQPRGVYG